MFKIEVSIERPSILNGKHNFMMLQPGYTTEVKPNESPLNKNVLKERVGCIVEAVMNSGNNNSHTEGILEEIDKEMVSKNFPKVIDYLAELSKQSSIPQNCKKQIESIIAKWQRMGSASLMPGAKPMRVESSRSNTYHGGSSLRNLPIPISENLDDDSNVSESPYKTSAPPTLLLMRNTTASKTLFEDSSASKNVLSQADRITYRPQQVGSKYDLGSQTTSDTLKINTESNKQPSKQQMPLTKGSPPITPRRLLRRASSYSSTSDMLNTHRFDLLTDSEIALIQDLYTQAKSQIPSKLNEFCPTIQEFAQTLLATVVHPQLLTEADRQRTRAWLYSRTAMNQQMKGTTPKPLS